jgi:hypothetical protein
VLNSNVSLSIAAFNPVGCQIRYNTLLGLSYKLQSTPDLSQLFSDEPLGSVAQATNSSFIFLDMAAGPQKFYRVIGSLGQ